MKNLQPINVEEMTGEQFQELWEKVNLCEYAFDDYSRGRGEIFAHQLLMPASEHFTFNDSGYVTANAIRPGLDALVHFTFWDKVPVTEKLESGREFLGYLMNKYDLRRVTGLIPVMSKPAGHFALALGFKKEGTLRHAFLFKGEFVDVVLYGLLREELREM